MTDYDEHENYSNMNEQNGEDDEEDGIVEYLEIDNEVMETLQDPDDYFTQVNESHQGQIYVHQNAANTQQLSLVIQNSSNQYASLKEISPQQLNDHNSGTNVLWPNSIINSNNKVIARAESSCRSTSSRKNCKTNRKRKVTSSSNSPDNNSKHVNQKDVMMGKGEIQSDGDSLDLFFQSMAQTVSHLPSQIQAKIKMDICNVISMAEIKYCSQETNLQNNSNNDFNPKN